MSLIEKIAAAAVLLVALDFYVGEVKGVGWFRSSREAGRLEGR